MSSVDRYFAAASTTLDEIARAISELNFERELQGRFVVSPKEELKALKNIFRKCAALKGERVSDDLCGLTACLILEAMVAQQLWDLELFRRSQSPFCAE